MSDKHRAERAANSDMYRNFLKAADAERGARRPRSNARPSDGDMTPYETRNHP